jgi:LacI family transcriptional regulator
VVECEYLNLLRDYHAEGGVFAGSGLVEDDEALTASVAAARRQGMHVVALAPAQLRGQQRHRRQPGRRLRPRGLSGLARPSHDGVRGWAARPVSARERLDGFLGALSDRDLDPGPLYEGDFSYAAGHAAALRLPAEPRLPDAVACANDETAIGVPMGLRGGGVDVPGTVSVAGIGDTRPAGFLELTTVSVHTYELGASAARRIIAGRTEDAEAKVLIPRRLVPRATSARRTRRKRERA